MAYCIWKFIHSLQRSLISKMRSKLYGSYCTSLISFHITYKNITQIHLNILFVYLYTYAWKGLTFLEKGQVCVSRARNPISMPAFSWSSPSSWARVMSLKVLELYFLVSLSLSQARWHRSCTHLNFIFIK